MPGPSARTRTRAQRACASTTASWRWTRRAVRKRRAIRSATLRTAATARVSAGPTTSPGTAAMPGPSARTKTRVSPAHVTTTGWRRMARPAATATPARRPTPAKPGSASGTNPIVCNDNNTCTDDSCNTSNGACVYVANDANSCTDGNVCTSDTCSSGACVHAASGACSVGGTVYYYRDGLSNGGVGRRAQHASRFRTSGSTGRETPSPTSPREARGTYAFGSVFGNVDDHDGQQVRKPAGVRSQRCDLRNRRGEDRARCRRPRHAHDQPALRGRRHRKRHDQRARRGPGGPVRGAHRRSLRRGDRDRVGLEVPAMRRLRVPRRSGLRFAVLRLHTAVAGGDRQELLRRPLRRRDRQLGARGVLHFGSGRRARASRTATGRSSRRFRRPASRVFARPAWTSCAVRRRRRPSFRSMA